MGIPDWDPTKIASELSTQNRRQLKKQKAL
jgi:hypothetical protein